MEKTNKIVSRRNGFVIGVLAVLILLGSALGGVSAKYVKDAGEQKAVVRAKEFYFSSDLLKEGGATYTLNPGTTSITFDLSNHDDQLRCSESNIGYSVSVSGEAMISPASGSLEGKKNANATITLSKLEDGQTYTVTATGNAGYVKTLSATFIVKSQSERAYKYLEMDPSGAFVVLTVWTENVSGNVSISFPAGLIPDTTDNALAGIHNYSFVDENADGKDDDGIAYIAQTNAAAGTLGVYSSYTYRFFLEEPYANYTVNDFTVTVGGKTAMASTPE